MEYVKAKKKRRFSAYNTIYHAELINKHIYHNRLYSFSQVEIHRAKAEFRELKSKLPDNYKR